MIVSRTAAGKSGSEAFYTELLMLLNDSKVSYRVGGTCAVNEYIGLRRPTKDIDVFCRAGDFPRLLSACANAGYGIEVEDERWLAKIVRDAHFCDVVFGSANMVAPVTEQWFTEHHPATVYGVPILLLPPTELIWSKVFIMDRYKFDGNDVVHLMLRKHDAIDWNRLMSYHDQHWEVLLLHVLRFRYIYPAERDVLPDWVLDELLRRVNLQRQIPPAGRKVCRGRIFSREDFVIDIADWGFADLIGEAGEILARWHETQYIADHPEEAGCAQPDTEPRDPRAPRASPQQPESPAPEHPPAGKRMKKNE